MPTSDTHPPGALREVALLFLRLGLTAFATEGDPFDPELHEAVQHEGDGSNPVLGTVMRQGYRLGEQVLRHAMVGVVDEVPGESGDVAPQSE